ncbi:MAG: hypothetical protein KDK51_09530 [Deltaproteobacteria bacterium]|nr:hypothetical protein [Deltaproteobacteria bacterium]
MNQNVKLGGPAQEYIRGDQSTGFHFCQRCGCVLFWLGKRPDPDGLFEVAINLRLTNTPHLIQSIPIKPYDGLNTSKELPPLNKTIEDVWF